MFRGIVAALLFFVAAMAFLVWYIQRSGEKVLYLNARTNLQSIKMAEIALSTWGTFAARGADADQTRTEWCVTADQGDLVIRRVAFGPPGYFPSSLNTPKMELLKDFLGMLARNKRGFIVAVRRVSIPLWVVIVSSAGLGLALTAVPVLVRSLRAWRRRAVGHCQKCGYDLTGNVSGRCPECGTPVPDARPERESV